MRKALTSFILIGIQFASLTVVEPRDARAATTVKQVVCNKNGELIVREGRCRRGETRVNFSQLVQSSVSAIQSVPGPQGPVGPQGATGAVGPQGDPAGFDVTACYRKQSTTGPLANVPANNSNIRSVACNNPSTEFMLSSGFNVAPSGSANNKPFVQTKIFDLDPTGKYPVGVSYSFIQSISSGNPYSTFVDIICCPR